MDDIKNTTDNQYNLNSQSNSKKNHQISFEI